MFGFGDKNKVYKEKFTQGAITNDNYTKHTGTIHGQMYGRSC